MSETGQRTWHETRPSLTGLAAAAGRTLAHVGYDRVMVRRVADPDSIPPSLDAVTAEWLTATLSPDPDTAHVSAFALDRPSAGTSERARITLHWSAAVEGLPRTVFAKTTPGVLTRLANGASGTSPAEAAFYTELRPLLDPELNVPRSWHSAADSRSFRSIHLLEDVATERGATFWQPATMLGREQAEAAMDLLGEVHRRFAAVEPPAAVVGYCDWWTRAMKLADIRRATDRYLGSEDCPEELRRRADDVWPAFVRSVDRHLEGPETLLHADVHAGNWYVTSDGRPGLCDWQCVCWGHPSLDFAYAVCTLLTTAQRREWERDLLQRWIDAAALDCSFDDAWLDYRRQVPGALLKWTPALNTPPGLPEMQPRETALELLDRISAALLDLGSLDAA